MNKELQDKAWSVLPKEFKEEVKRKYYDSYKYEGIAAREYEVLFGFHNLTSDEEGVTELLSVTRQKVMGLYANAKKIHNLYTSATCINANESQQIDICIGIMSVLDTLFGSKCLKDELVSDCYQLPEPKYHKGDKVCYNGYVYEVEGLVGKNRYALKGLNFDLDEDMIDHYEPCTEPEEFANLSQNIVDCDKMIDDILKDSFRNELRQTIAAMAMQGILSNESRMRRYEDMATAEPRERLTDIVARNALRYADALIAECVPQTGHSTNF